jgi:hypothetical protein
MRKIEVTIPVTVEITYNENEVTKKEAKRIASEITDTCFNYCEDTDEVVSHVQQLLYDNALGDYEPNTPEKNYYDPIISKKAFQSNVKWTGWSVGKPMN